MQHRLTSALQALEDHRPGDAWAIVRDLIAENAGDPFALGIGAAALRLLGHRHRAEQLHKRAAAAALPAFPTAAELDFVRRLDELASTTTSVARRYASEGGYWYGKGNREKAEVCLLKALDLDPSCAMAHYYRGIIAAEQGRASIARLCFVSAMQADPGCMAARTALLGLMTKKKFSFASIAAAL